MAVVHDPESRGRRVVGEVAVADEWGQSFARDIGRERADSARYANAWQHGGGPVWQHPAYDPETHLLFINVGNPAPDNDGAVRPGDNLYTDCIVALDANAGTVQWYYQEVSHDLWDYDASTPPILVDAPDSQGHTVKAVAKPARMGSCMCSTARPAFRSANPHRWRRSSATCSRQRRRV